MGAYTVGKKIRNFIWNLQWYISYYIAVLYQKCWWTANIPIVEESWMDLLWWLCKVTYPEPVADEHIPASMIEVIRGRMGVPEEEFYGKLKKIHEDAEREKVGLPPKD